MDTFIVQELLLTKDSPDRRPWGGEETVSVHFRLSVCERVIVREPSSPLYCDQSLSHRERVANVEKGRKGEDGEG